MSQETDLAGLVAGLTDGEIADLVDSLPPGAVAALLDSTKTRQGQTPSGPVGQALELDPKYRTRPHLDYLSGRVAAAVADVEAGRNQMLAVTLPPRSGKSTLLSVFTPLWILRRHPGWKVILTSYDAALVGGWAGQVRDLIEQHPELGVRIAPDGGAKSSWGTVEGGSMFATSVRGTLTGRGTNCLILDDPTKDFVEAHSPVVREQIWNWWLSVAQTRLEHPFLVVALQTRWHESDLIGRALSSEYEGDPGEWEQITLPAVAETDDVLGRAPGEPLLSPLLDETTVEASARWEGVRRSVGSYVWAALYQQRPSPAKGSIFDSEWWRFWTDDPASATEDGRVVYLDPDVAATGRWLDSWDCAFKGTDTSDFVVGQRWVRVGANRFLVAQQRGRWSFTETLARMERWAAVDDEAASPYGRFVHQRLIEEAANGAAIIDVLRDRVSGLKPVRVRVGKEARARAITPEVESGNVLLPLPSGRGNGWVQDALSELREFPHGTNDDVVDALTQALAGLRESGRGGLSVPGGGVGRDVARAAASDRRRGLGVPVRVVR